LIILSAVVLWLSESSRDILTGLQTWLKPPLEAK
jgi:hypothetical protein